MPRILPWMLAMLLVATLVLPPSGLASWPIVWFVAIPACAAMHAWVTRARGRGPARVRDVVVPTLVAASVAGAVMLRYPSAFPLPAGQLFDGLRNSGAWSVLIVSVALAAWIAFG